MTIILMLLIVLLSGCAGERAPSADLNKGKLRDFQYGAIVDAGSTGSRIDIFKWRRSEGASDNKQFPRDIGDIANVKDTNEKVNDDKPCPVTHFLSLDEVSRLATCSCLHKLTAVARKEAEERVHHSLPEIDLWVKATAGVRILDASAQKTIIRETSQCLEKVNGYKLKDSNVITGEEEGLYAWLTVNYPEMEASEGSPKQTYGIVEIGGTSAQMAYLYPEGNAPTPTSGGIKTLRNLKVYSTSSFLGINEIKKPYNLGEAYNNDCANGKDPRECVENTIKPFLTTNGPLIDSHFVPRPTIQFVALSNAAHPIRNLGLENEKNATLKMVLDRANDMCGPDQEKMEALNEILERAKVEEKHRKSVCFNSLFATQLANFRWGIRLENISLPEKKYNGWAKGAFVMELLRSH